MEMEGNNSDSDEVWSDWEEEELGEGVSVKSLFGPELFTTIEAVVSHDSQEYDFDVFKIKKDLGLDFYGFIRLVNYARAAQIDSKTKAKELKEQLHADASVLGDDCWLQPVLADDALLYHQGGNVSATNEEPEGSDSDTESGDGSAELKEADQAQLVANIAPQLEMYKNLVDRLTGPAEKDNDTYYFDSYSHFGIHETMLRDKPRTGAYEEAILKNSERIKDKVVLDVGCGSGVLSLFAAKAGAAKVIGVDQSGILKHAQKVIELNGMAEKIDLVQGKMEDLILPVEKVDFIVSEWMGYALFYEAMLSSVLHARDIYLKPEGGLFPNTCRIFLEGMREDGRIEWWDDVHGLNMVPLRDLALLEPSVEVVPLENIITEPSLLKAFDLMTVKDEELDFEVPFTLTPTKEGPMHAFIIWFDVGFQQPVCAETAEVILATSPRDPSTHWKQVALWIRPENTSMFTSAGESIEGKFRLQRAADNPRELDFEVEWTTSSNNAEKRIVSQKWHMGS